MLSGMLSHCAVQLRGDGVSFPDTKLKVDKRYHLPKESIVQRDFPLVSHLLFI